MKEQSLEFWSYFSKDADINLVTNNINVLQDYIAVYIETVLDRIFTNKD